MAKTDFIYQDPTDIDQVAGSTPFAIYDGDPSFVSESVQMCKYVSRKLGHPVMQIEMASGSIYACYEEAVSEYSQFINNYNIRNWMWESYGADSKLSGDANTGSMSTGSIEPTHPHMGFSSHLSKQYGEAINVGGDLTMYSGSITLTSSKQTYTLTSSATFQESGHSSKTIEIQRILNYGKAAIAKFYDPFAGGMGTQNMLDDMGMGGMSPAVSFIMRPISADIVRAMTIETSDRIRKSAYSFELQNNKLRIFPIPKSGDNGDKIWFHYYLREDRTNTKRASTAGKVTDPSNIPYKFITYKEINASGRQWIRRFTLALSKELLGIIRSKYANMPLPNGEVSLDGEALKTEGREEQANLAEQLKELLDQTSLSEKSRIEQEQAESQQAVLNKAPLGIYIG